VAQRRLASNPGIRRNRELASHDTSRSYAVNTESGRRLWLPLLDGAERLGVLGLTLPRVDDPLRKRCSWLATLIAEMLMSKDQYTDSYSLSSAADNP
jgi:hypothetical protein